MTTEPDVLIIGAGPVGLAAAAHALDRGLTPLVLERGASVGAAIGEWQHVRVFTPWRYIVDAAAKRLLERAGWPGVDEQALPTGAEILSDYLVPLATRTVLAEHIRLDAEVTAITRAGADKTRSSGRAHRPFELRWRDAAGRIHRARAPAVIDASGTYRNPNPMGKDGLPVPGETELGDILRYGIPDVLDAERAAYTGKRTLVLGSGHSASNVALDLARLAQSAAGTTAVWVMRSDRLAQRVHSAREDELPARGALEAAAYQAVQRDAVELIAPATGVCGGTAALDAAGACCPPRTLQPRTACCGPVAGTAPTAAPAGEQRAAHRSGCCG